MHKVLGAIARKKINWKEFHLFRCEHKYNITDPIDRLEAEQLQQDLTEWCTQLWNSSKL